MPQAASDEPVLLALRALHLGDLLAAVPALRALRRAWPAHRLVLAAPAGLAPIAELIGGIGEVWPTGEDLLWSVAPPGADIAVNLHGKGPRSHRLLDRLSPRQRIGYAAPGWPGPRWQEGLHERDRWCALLRAHSIAADPGDLRLCPPGASGRPGAVVLNPGATYGSRRWPLPRFSAVAAALAKAGYDVVVTGTAAERDRSRALAELAGLPESSVLAGRTGVLDIAALVADARLVISTDSGIAHLSYAYATPSVVLFGPAPISEWGPPEGGPHRALTSSHPRGDPFADTTDPALLGVSITDVIVAADELLRVSR
jgi:ADP-heptose:LPS heptosyltransferase